MPALSTAPAPSADPADPSDPAWQRLGPVAWQQRDHLRRSIRAVHLFDWLGDPGRYRALVGNDGYREAVLEMLAGASAADCEAAGMRTRDGLAVFTAPAFTIWAQFSPSGRHRVVFWLEPPSAPARAWGDGRPVGNAGNGEPVIVLPPGNWASERFFGVPVPAPADHPAQPTRDGDDSGPVHGLLIWDAVTHRVFAVEQPHAGEHWQWPVLVEQGNELKVLGSPPRGAPASELATLTADRTLRLG